MAVESDPLGTADIAVVGMAARLPGAGDVRQFWDNLRNGVESVTHFSDEALRAAGESPHLLADPDYVPARPVLADVDQFDAAFFGFSPQDAAIMDPQHRVFLEVGWEALEHAGYDAERVDGTVGVFATCGMNTYMMYHLVTNQRIMDTVGEWLVRHTGNDMNFLATRLSYELGLKGPSMNVQTACSSALVAIHLACQSLLNGECDMALAGGSVIALPQDRGYLYKNGEILSPDGHCRAFDARAQGTLFGSGAGVVVLRRLADALEAGDQVLAIVKGSAVNNDGSMKVGYLAPSVEGQSRAVIEALAVSGVSPETISYVEAHGTGTLVGDPIEITAITEAFRRSTDKKQFCAIGSLKTNIGHLGEAAGVAGFIKTVLALQHREIPPSLHFETPNPRIEFAESPFFVNAVLRPWMSPAGPRRAGLTSLGAGGTNCHVILQEAPPSTASGDGRPAQLLVLSARTPTALDAAAANLATRLEQEPDLSLADAAYTLQVGRKAFSHRRALVCQRRDDAIEALRSGRGVHNGTSGSRPPAAVFMFPGQGAQYLQMGRGLYDGERVFRDAYDRCAAILTPDLRADLRDVVFGSTEAAAEARLHQTAFTQPALFVTEYALARLWMSWGVQPQQMIGHSIGEYVAACLAGVMTLEEALMVVAARGALMQSMAPGAMLSVACAASDLTEALRDGSLSLAASNAPALSVVSGPDAALAAFEAGLRAKGIECQRLRTSHAFHSFMLDPMLDRFAAVMRRVTLRPPTIPFVSNLTGGWIRAEEATDPQYWVRHVRGTVRFAEGLTTILREADRVLLEVGPGRTLSSLARQAQAKPVAIVTSLRHARDEAPDLDVLLGAAGRLWSHGLAPDWSAFHEGGARRRVALPTYPFERQRYWVEAGNPLAAATIAPTTAEPSGEKQADIADWFYSPSWRRSPLPTAASDAMDGDTLVFADAIGLGAGLVERLASGRSGGANPDASEAFQLQFPVPGDADTVTLPAVGRDAPGPGQVEIQVRAAALNFADVLKVTGMQPDAPFGMECAGVVTRIGDRVTTCAPGDAVVAIGPDSFRSHLVRDARFVAPMPPGLSWAEAATIPAAFMTACYALEQVGKLERGERILIHAASGGVGLAAVRLAQARGAEIFATAGSPEKRAHLESLGISHVFHSRTLDFADEIARRTGGAGVDVVLNSLTGEFIPRSLRLLARNGRFLEIGKKEIYSAADLAPLGLQPGVTYHAIDLTRTLRDDPDLYGRLLRDVVDRVRDRTLAPLAHRVFPVGDAVSAFGLMIQARHIGKVVLSFDRQAGRTYVVEAGPRFERVDATHFTVDPSRAEDYGALFDQLGEGAKRLRRIIHLWNVGGRDEATVDEQLTTSFFSPLYLAQAIGHEELTQPLDLVFVSTGVQQVAGETEVQPGKAAILGPCRVVPREYPNVACRSVDVIAPSAPWQRERLLQQLAAELSSDVPGGIVAHRGADRWVQEFARVRLEAPPGPLVDGGVYLITGGLGGLGLEVAAQIASTARARLILVGRTALPPRDEWPAWVAAHGADDPVSRKVRLIQSWEAGGTQVIVADADVADRERMRAVLAHARRVFGPITGVFHAAGVLDDGLMQLKTHESAQRVLRAKIHGTLALDDVLAEQEPEFLVLFSSVSSVFGLQGQVDYTAANAFLDAFAQSKAVRGRMRVTAINWGAWQEVGVAASASQARRRTGRVAAPAGQHPWLESSRMTPAGGVVFTTAFNRAKQWVIGEHVIKGSEALLPGTGFLEIAGAAVHAQSANGPAVELSNVFFQSPFIVRGDETKDLEVELTPAGAQYDFTIRSKSGVHVTGRGGPLRVRPPARSDLAALRRRCATAGLTAHGFLDQGFMDFGPRWGNVESIAYGAGEALVALNLPPAFVDDLAHCRLHPALLDMATGGAQHLIPGFDRVHDFYVPFSYGRLRSYEAIGPRVYSHVRLANGSAGGGTNGVALFDISLLNEQGDPVADVDGFCMKRVADRAALAARLEETPTLAPDAAPEPATSPSIQLAEDMLARGIRPGEGGEALRRILHAPAGPQVVVSSVDLAYWHRRLDAPARAAREAQRQTTPASRESSALRERGRALASAPAPTGGDVQVKLAEIWSELLGIESVGLQDNFFDIGGHSLLAVRLLTKIEKTFHKTIPLQALFQGGTIESLSALLRQEAPAAPVREEVIVPLIEGSSGPALYLVHSLGGNVMSFLTLSKALGPDQPLYGIQAPLSGDVETLASSIEALAAHYVDALTRFQPEGPYLLGGWSAGSSIALEMAQQLQRSGRQVELLVALDGAPFNSGARTRPWDLRYALKLLRNFPLWIADDLMVNFSARVLWRRIRTKAVALMHGHLSRWRGDADDPGYTVAGFLDTSTWSERERTLMRRLFGALMRYRPEPYAGRVLVYQSRTEPLYHLFEIDKVWRNLATDVTLVRVGGTHISLIQAPHVQALADDLRTRLTARVDERRAP